ncbi:hypothetical protein, conserved [Babesia bigemina]|uniref:Uncharacterized protein n=1 Tax=Babesia bigemina TaxID=5866 RepID=A0A061DCX9_BABBI|nr:hypothetical protein, conserved [Babesia bigemina]CDR98072.1 hypothetical protein, conserved [Babesia bigemina]|eukprot:XP_012770258.1 hypothetical protein, conserved [Babesia bigemina]
MGIADNPKYRRINDDIAAGRFYDSLQHVLSASQRAVIAKRYSEALEVLHHFAEVYIRAGEYAQSLELMKEYMKIASKSDIEFTEANIDQVKSFFCTVKDSLSCAQEPLSGPLAKDAILEKSLAIADSALELNPHPKLQLCIGQHHWDEGQLSEAQGYLIQGQDIEVLSKFLESWASIVQEHERPFVYLRCILIQLATGDDATAKCLLLMLNQDFESSDTLAYIFTELCENPDYLLYKVACKVYRPIIDADPNFPRLVHHLRERLFPGHHDPTDPFQYDPSSWDVQPSPATAMEPYSLKP